jgi:diguanylate cyclase (GGDEF)-like protein
MVDLKPSDALLIGRQRLERAVGWVRVAAAAVLIVGSILTDIDVVSVGLGAALIANTVLVAVARPSGAADRQRLRQASAAADVGSVCVAMFVYSPDPLWALPAVGALVIVTSSLRAGAGSAMPYAAALSIAYVAATLFRAQVLGLPAAVHRVVLDLAVYQLTGLLMRWVHGEFRLLGTQLEYRSLYDILTGLPGLTLLLDAAERTIAAAARRASKVALLVIELEDFTAVNTTFGYETGDLLLQQVAPRLLGSLPEATMIGRLGGAKFAALLSAESAAAAAVAAQKVLHALERPVMVAQRPLDVEARIGIALYPENGTHAEDLLRRGEHAARAARASDDSYALASLMAPGDASRLELAGELRSAIERDELVLHYQPVVSIKTSRVVGAEALVRWRHPRRGLLAPDEFIPVAERTTLVKPLTRWVLDAALRDHRAWRAAGHDLGVSVNVSMGNVMDPQLPATLRGLLDASGAEAAWCALEITESVLMAHPARALEILSQLRRMGVRLVVDDFGTGYSSLAYLHRLAVDEVKIDKSFVLNMGADASSVAIVRAAIELGRTLDFEIVAEGVEDRGTWETLASLGCDMAQGYYIAAPMDKTELDRWLTDSEWMTQGRDDTRVN